MQCDYIFINTYSHIDVLGLLLLIAMVTLDRAATQLRIIVNTAYTGSRLRKDDYTCFIVSYYFNKGDCVWVGDNADRRKHVFIYLFIVYTYILKTKHLR